MGAADTFRAAAIEQLQVWADRSGCDLVKHAEGSDPAAVVFDALKAGQSRGADIIIADTAGRLHNKINLMNELTKIRNVMRKVVPDAPHEVLLVLDASTGQNAYQQAKEFAKALGVSDGTVRGWEQGTFKPSLKAQKKIVDFCKKNGIAV